MLSHLCPVSPIAVSTSSSKILAAWRSVLLIQAFRPDRLLARIHSFIDFVLVPGFMAENPRKLADAVEKEIEAMTPVVLCGISGYDASTNVRDLCAASNMQCTEIALGAEEVCSCYVIVSHALG
jgi:dynein heavy chain 1